MTFLRVALASIAYYRRTYVAVVLGVASAVAVLAGSLLVGESVRGSLAALTSGRLGRADVVVAAERPFTEDLAARLMRQPAIAGAFPDVTPLLALQGLVRHDASGRRAGRVSVYGVDARFFAFHGSPAAAPDEGAMLLSPALAAELGAATGDPLLLRVARPTDIPADSLHGRRDEIGRTIRLRNGGVLAAASMGEFALAPGQGAVRAVFVSAARLQRDLGVAGRANSLLLAAAPGSTPNAAAVERALSASLDVADLGLTFTTSPDEAMVLVESSSGLIPDAIAATAGASAARASLAVSPVLTWLANAIGVAGRSVPYSIVTAIGPGAAGDRAIAQLLQPATGGPPPIVLNAWTAADLQAKTGDALDLEYYRWADDGRLVTERTSFRVAGVVPMSGLAIDRRLAPDYPGITESKRFTDWDPPFPIDLSRVRPKDEDYWDRYRTSPKAFVALDVGQRLWRSRYGQVTSLRLQREAPGVDLKAAIDRVREEVTRDVSPSRAGFNVVDVRRQNLEASAGATDFGAYFAYFSFFLMVAALLLAALFFRLSLETRQAQLGVLRATGFSASAIRRLLGLEGLAVALVGALAGVGLAIGWAALMMLGLRTWWIGAVGTSLLELHVDWRALALGAAGGTVSALVAIVVTVRSASRSTPRALLTGAADAVAPSARSRAGWLAVAALVPAIALSVLAAADFVPDAGAFFGAGMLVLTAGLAFFARWLQAQPAAGAPGRLASRSGRPGLVRFGLANASWRPGRSLTSAGLVAAAVFLLVSVDAFRKRADASGTAASGTGGFALIAESELPIVHDVATPEGRSAAGLDVAAGTPLAGVTLVGLRLRPGDDTSCLNLYQPRRPRMLGVPDRLVEAAPFRFAASLALSDADRANPWRLLGDAGPDGVVPAIVDATSLQYVLHAAVGDVITVDADTNQPIRLRIVASLDDSVLQGEILVADRAFRQLFPAVAGYRAFLVAVPGATPDRVDAVSRALEDALADAGFDAEDAERRLDAFHRVENTYLSTFQALGGLGLGLGCLGLVAVIARNVLERRRELALLGASGFTGRDLQVVVASEHLALVGVGLAVGVAAALVAVAPVVLTRGGALPWGALVWLAPVAIAGLLSALLATRGVRRLPLVESLRRE
jgi:ABC-type antimicrobial peptide transport system permease subunit